LLHDSAAASEVNADLTESLRALAAELQLCDGNVLQESGSMILMICCSPVCALAAEKRTNFMRCTASVQTCFHCRGFVRQRMSLRCGLVLQHAPPPSSELCGGRIPQQQRQLLLLLSC
jgi:hypothetical protein